MSNAYGFQQTPVNPSAPNTVNATQRQEHGEVQDLKTALMQVSREIDKIKETIASLTKDNNDLKKAIDQLTIDVYRKK